MTKNKITYKIDIDSKEFKKVLKNISDKFDRLEKRINILERPSKDSLKIALKSIDLNKDQIIVIKSDGIKHEQMDCIKATMPKRLKGSKNKISFLFLPNDTKIDIIDTKEDQGSININMNSLDKNGLPPPPPPKHHSTCSINSFGEYLKSFKRNKC